MTGVRNAGRGPKLLLLLFLLGAVLALGAGRYTRLTERHAAQLLTGYGAGTVWESLREVLELKSSKSEMAPGAHNSAITLPAGYSASNTGGRLIFAQVGDGDIPGANRFMQAMFLLVNDSPNPAAGTLQFFNDAGQPMNMTIGGTTASSFPVSLNNGEVKRLVTSGRGTVRSGWALLTTNEPITGVCSFSIRDAAGQVFADVGVGESTLSTELRLFADTKGDANTGIALINPDPAVPLNLQLDLVNTAGTVVSSKSLPLPARGHAAQYLDQLFAQAPGINEFEGTLVIRGAHKFGGVALRAVGALLTSVPTVPGLRFGDSRTRLIFPHIANGATGTLRIKTTFLLINNTTQTTTGTLHFVKPDGTPMTLSIGGQNRSSVDYTLNPGAVQRLVTTGSGGMATGWAWASMDKPIGGTTIFHIYDSTGRLLTEAGVLSSPTSTGLDAPVDMLGAARTAIALVNPNEEDSARVTLSLVDHNGTSKGTQELTLAPGEYRSEFIDELFSTAPGVTEMEGRVMISSGVEVTALTLRQTGIVTTSVPWVFPSLGFSPVCLLEFPEHLTGTAPLVRLRVEQNPMDLTMHGLRLEAPGLPVDLGQIRPGDEIGYGCYLMTIGGTFKLGGLVKTAATGTGSVLFELIGSGPAIGPGTALGSGKLDRTAGGGLVLELNAAEATACGEWNNGYGMELDLTLKAGIVKTPSSAGQTEIVTTYRSSSTKRDEDDVRVVRTSRQKVTFSAPVASKPRAVSQRPAFFSPGSPLDLYGGNWGTDPKVFFANTSGGESAAMLLSASADTLQVSVPTDAKEGNLRIVQGTNASNNLLSRTNFRPEISVTKTAGQGGAFSLGCSVKQEARQLGLQTADLRLYNILWQAAGLTADAQVGTAVVKGGASASAQSNYKVYVTSASSTQVELRVAPDSSSDPVWFLRLTKEGSQENPLTRLSIEPDEITETPSVLGFAWEMQIALPGLSFAPAQQQDAYYWMAEAFSGPADLLGSDTGIRINLGLKRLP